MMHREYWEAGLRVFGLHGADKNGNCACGWSECQAAYKHPLISNWQKTPEWSEEQIDVMEMSGQFDTGFGVLCAGLLVIDIDARNGGVSSFAKLVEAIPEAASAGLIVETGSGGGSKHYYFRAPHGAALLQHHPEYPGLDFKTSGYVVGPGSAHKSGNRYALAYGSPDDIDDAPVRLVALLARPDKHRSTYDGRTVDVSHSDIADMLAYIDPDCDYDTWIRCGMAVHDATGGTGFQVWDEWSSKGVKYNSDTMDSHWHSFGRSANPVTFGTLAHHAEAGGWQMPVSFTPQVEFDLPPEKIGSDRGDGLPFDISGVDLKRPPDFAGELAAWIEDQSRRPRENLAVAAALVGLGNVSGLRYTDDRDGVTTNLLAFCVAGSRTGKEAIQQAQSEIHRAAGIAPATHGAIKSEQEITRNLTRNQAALYIIDEVGLFLQKVKNAQTKGGALYLDGVIGLIMAAYSKADSFMLLTGDMKEELRSAMTKEAAALRKKIEESEAGPYAEKRLASLEQALRGIDKGLERPFLSMIGYTTPVTFDTLVDYQSAANGFIGRSLIFNDRDTAPRSKRTFRKRAMSDGMAARLQQIFSGGEYDIFADGGRIEYYGPRRKIPTTQEAHAMLDAALDWFEDQAIEHKRRTGLEALYLGAYELVSKVSLVLAVDGGTRTAEHVRWAFALVRRDVEDKMRLVTANDREKDAPALALAAKIANVIGDDGETLGVIYNRLRRFKRTDVDAALAKMVENGVACRKVTKHPKNGSDVVVFCLHS
jgi:hypothetical protein